MTFEQRLRHLRKKHHLSQEQLAALVSTTRQTVSQWETGKSVPSLDSLNILAQHYGVSLDYLVNGVEVSPKEPEPSAAAAAEPAKRPAWHTMLQTVCIALCLVTLAIVIAVFIKEDDPQPTGQGIHVSQEDMDVKYVEPDPDLGFDLEDLES